MRHLSWQAEEGPLFVPAELPPLTPDESARVTAMRRHLHTLVQASGGLLPFARFMEEALYAPGLGYYAAGRRVFGPRGDYTTASSESDAYAALFAHKVAGLMHAGLPPEVLEIGPGTGRFAADFVRELHRRGVALKAYHLLEPHLPQEQEQRSRLDNGSEQAFHWCRRAPAGFRGLVLAHEVFDAQPCARFTWDGRRHHGWGLVTEGDRLGWRLGPPTPDLAAEIAVIRAELNAPLPVPYVSEAAADYGRIFALLEEIPEALFLIVDYGHPRREFYHHDRCSGTLRCHYRQRVHDDPLHAPGVEDITAHVDFSRLACLANTAGWTVEGFTSLAGFAVAQGSLEAVAISQERRRALARLVDPSVMGEVFKVLVLVRGESLPFPDLERSDRLASL